MRFLPQLILFSLCILTLGSETAKHGEPNEIKHNARTTLFGLVMLHGLLYWGGFYNGIF
jgi:hypothetical protein